MNINVKTEGRYTVVTITNDKGVVQATAQLDAKQAQQVGEAMFVSGRVNEARS